MNEQVVERINSSLEQVEQWIGEAEALTREQVPLIVEEIILYGMVFYGGLVALGLVGVLIGAIGVFKVAPHFQEKANLKEEAMHDAVGSRKGELRSESEEYQFFSFFVFSTSAIGIVVSTTIFLGNLFNFLFVLVAPRLYVIDQIADYIQEAT